jgi:phosphatidylglycerol lysyltransferase
VSRELRDFRLGDAAAYLRALAPAQVVLALIATVGSYAALAACDALATRLANRPLSLSRTTFASFISSAVSNVVGLSGLAGGTLRFRLYTAWGFSAVEAGRVVAFSTATFWLGYTTLAGVILTLHPLALPRAAGPLLLVVPAVYLSVPAFAGRRGLASLQIIAGVVDWMFAAAVFCVLLPHDRVPLLTALAIFLAAQLAGVMSGVPAGAGVFEAAVIAGLSGIVGANTAVAVLLAYRLIYYLMPLSAAAALMGGGEVLRRRAALTTVASGVLRVASLFVPALFSVLLFIDGVVLLASGATPSAPLRITLLRTTLPLALVELAHLIGSMSGAGLLLLARGVQRRLNAAFYLSLAFLGSGIVASLLKGLDYEEATLMAVTLAFLIPCRQHFYRKTALLDEPFTPGWIAAIGFAAGSSMWLGMFVYRDIAYSPALWWHFSFAGDASRFLRASVTMAVVVLAFSVRKLFRPASAELAATSKSDLARAEEIARHRPGAPGYLVLLGDKSLLFDDSGSAFLMYGVHGRSWVAMGDPIGPPEAARILAWSFFQQADRHNGWPVFYQAGTAHLPTYIELGLQLLKFGEEARVRTANFTLSGGARKSLRHSVRKLETDGVEFEVVNDCTPLLGQLRAISESWLVRKRTSEKSFSIGRFDEEYLRRLPVALVRHHGVPVAFANLWSDDVQEELTVDLMRYSNEAPPAVMDFLFVHLIFHARAQHYRWFNLGVAPLSGIEARAQGPLWGRAAALGMEHGGRFYNFHGLRQYKEKFDPVWDPIFLASPGGIRLPLILRDVAALIARGRSRAES